MKIFSIFQMNLSARPRSSVKASVRASTVGTGVPRIRTRRPMSAVPHSEFPVIIYLSRIGISHYFVVDYV